MRPIARILPFLLLLSAGISPVAAEHVERDAVDWACSSGASRQPGDCGIRAIHDPQYTTRSWIPADDRVIGVSIGGETKAFPTRMLDEHEVVSDTIGGTAVAVTWCPLCGSAVVFERLADVGGERRLLKLDVSGYLYKHDLVMWDDGTRTLWAQITGETIATWEGGQMDMDHPNATLEMVPSELTTWSAWRKEHPSSVMLSNEGRSYGGSYEGYEDSCRIGVSSERRCDVDDLHPKEFVAGLDLASGAVAYPLFALRNVGGVVVDEREDVTVVVVAEREGAARAFDAGGRTFHEEEGQWVDEEGVPWDLSEGRSAGGFQELDRLDAVTLYWFAWKEHHPETDLWLPEGASGGKQDERVGVPSTGPAAGLALVVAFVAFARRRAWGRGRR